MTIPTKSDLVGAFATFSAALNLYVENEMRTHMGRGEFRTILKAMGSLVYYDADDNSIPYNQLPDYARELVEFLQDYDKAYTCRTNNSLKLMRDPSGKIQEFLIW